MDYKLTEIKTDEGTYKVYVLLNNIGTHKGVILPNGRWIDWNKLTGAAEELLLTLFDNAIPKK